MEQAVILLYNATPVRREEICGIAQGLGIGVRIVAQSEYGESLGALCGLGPLIGKKSNAEPFTDEMLLLAFLTKEQFHAFLDGFREKGIRGVPLKAMLTPTNAAWDSCRLHTDLKAEYDAFARAAKKQGGA